MEKFLELQIDIKDIKVNFSEIKFTFKNFWEWLFESIYVKVSNFDDWNVLVLIMLAIVIFTQIKKYKKEKRMNIKLSIFSSVLLLFFVFLSINLGSVCKVEILQREWGFGNTLSIIRYSKKVKENNVIHTVKFLKIEEDGVLVEYENVKYIINNNLEEDKIKIPVFDFEVKKEILQQKLLWGKTYVIKKAEEPNGLMVDGGIEYYYKFEK